MQSFLTFMLVGRTSFSFQNFFSEICTSLRTKHLQGDLTIPHVARSKPLYRTSRNASWGGVLRDDSNNLIPASLFFKITERAKRTARKVSANERSLRSLVCGYFRVRSFALRKLGGWEQSPGATLAYASLLYRNRTCKVKVAALQCT